MRKRDIPPLANKLGKREAALVLCYLPVHIFILPAVLGGLASAGLLSEAAANLTMYAIGLIYMLAAGGGFLKRELEPFVDNMRRCVLQVCLGLGLTFLLNFIVNYALMGAQLTENPNNAAITGIAVEQYGAMALLSVLMAPIVEEMMFRAGIFGVLRRHSRLLAYVVCIAAFSLYHVWGYAVREPQYWIYTVQYIPVSFILCLCYEKCGSIWGSISLHMIINAISLKALTALQELM